MGEALRPLSRWLLRERGRGMVRVGVPVRGGRAGGEAVESVSSPLAANSIFYLKKIDYKKIKSPILYYKIFYNKNYPKRIFF